VLAHHPGMTNSDRLLRRASLLAKEVSEPPSYVRFFAEFFPLLRVFEADFFEDDRDTAFFGTLAPSRRASDSPMAMACLRLVTLRPEPPLFRVPALRFFIARSTSADAFLEYFALAALPVASRKSAHAKKVPRLYSVRRPQPITDAGLGQDEMRTLRIGLDLLAELADIDAQILCIRQFVP
jgi:hypothetical protein